MTAMLLRHISFVLSQINNKQAPSVCHKARSRVTRTVHALTPHTHTHLSLSDRWGSIGWGREPWLLDHVFGRKPRKIDHCSFLGQQNTTDSLQSPQLESSLLTVHPGTTDRFFVSISHHAPPVSSQTHNENNLSTTTPFSKENLTIAPGD